MLAMCNSWLFPFFFSFLFLFSFSSPVSSFAFLSSFLFLLSFYSFFHLHYRSRPRKMRVMPIPATQHDMSTAVVVVVKCLISGAVHFHLYQASKTSSSYQALYGKPPAMLQDARHCLPVSCQGTPRRILILRRPAPSTCASCSPQRYHDDEALRLDDHGKREAEIEKATTEQNVRSRIYPPSSRCWGLGTTSS